MIYIFLVFTALFGFLITYIENLKLNLIIIGGLFLLALSTFIPQIGFALGSNILSTKNVKFHDSRYTYHGDIYYDGRTHITFYDYDIKKIITLNKKDLK